MASVPLRAEQASSPARTEPAIWSPAQNDDDGGCKRLQCTRTNQRSLRYARSCFCPRRSQVRAIPRVGLDRPVVVTALGAKGYTPPEVGKTFARARALCQAVGEMQQLFPVLFGLWIYYIMRAEFNAAGQLAGQIEDLASRAHDQESARLGNLVCGGTALFLVPIAVAILG